MRRAVSRLSLTALFSVATLGAAGQSSPLADAVQRRDTQAIQSLLKAHADVNAPQSDGATALHWAAYLDDADTAALLIRAGVNPGNVDRALASIDEEIARMAAEGPTDRELAESRQFLIGSLPRRLETNVGIANFLQTVEFFDLGMDYDLRVPGLLARVTRDDVHAAARAILDPARAAVVIAGPYTGS